MNIVFKPCRTNDREDWIEANIQLVTAIKDGRYPVVYDGDYEWGDIYIGVLSVHDIMRSNCVWPDRGQYTLVNQYAKTKTFKKHCGREIELTGFNAKDILSASEKISGDTVMVKYCAVQKRVSIEKIKKDGTEKPFFGAFDWELVRIGDGDERKDTTLVQQYIGMHHEYRIVVVDGNPVCGAGCVEVFSPLENKGMWDNQTQFNRKSDHSGIDTCHEMWRIYKDFAESVCPEFVAEGLLDYTLDVAVNDKGDPLIIELNPCFNFGMYALDYGQFYEEMIETAEKRSQRDCYGCATQRYSCKHDENQS